MTHGIVFAPEAEAQLAALYRYVAREASPQIAKRFTDAIMAFCGGLEIFPERGTPRDDLRPGLRTLTFRRRVTIAYRVEPTQVAILGVFYRGQDFEVILQED